MRRLLPLVVAVLMLAAPARAADGPTVRFDTSLGDVDVRLLPEAAPNTVATFLRYVGAQSYDSSYFHRSVRDFVIQGGGYRSVDDQTTAINELIADVDPFKRSNDRGTLATAKLPGQPDRATSQWFFNTADNSETLDPRPENYTVFGRVNDQASLAVMDAIAALAIVDGSGGNSGSAFGELPVRDYAGGAITDANLVFVESVRVVEEPSAPYAVPFKLKASNVKVKKVKGRLRVTVSRLPAGTNVVARLKQQIGVGAAGAGRVTITLPRRKGKLKVTATPPGQRPSSVTVKIR